MTFIESIKSVFSQYGNVSGRASRSEFWYFRLFIFLINMLFYVIGYSSPTLMLLHLFFIAIVIIPSVSVGVRRLHDTNKSGWWYLVLFVPFMNIIILYWLIIKGTSGNNNFGNPIIYRI